MRDCTAEYGLNPGSSKPFWESARFLTSLKVMTEEEKAELASIGISCAPSY
jgi:hypothetical protein